jgi:2-isopropylmalate synthase
VTDVWQPTPANKIILNLPATVEYATPNVHADQIEWMCTHLTRRDSTIISLHTHNDRGTGVAATELGLLAGADRVEGTLFGNGERTGNLDIVTVALNLYTHGIHPGLDFSATSTKSAKSTSAAPHGGAAAPAVRRRTGVHRLQRLASGRHQEVLGATNPDAPWDVLYIPIDPADIGRSYKAIIRINSQSGKGGVAYVLEHEFGCRSRNSCTRRSAKSSTIWPTPRAPSSLPPRSTTSSNGNTSSATSRSRSGSSGRPSAAATVTCQADLMVNRQERLLTGTGNGPIDAFVRASRRRPADVRVAPLQRALPRAPGRGARGELHPDQTVARPRPLRRRHRHQHRARLDQGDRQRAQR